MSSVKKLILTSKAIASKPANVRKISAWVLHVKKFATDNGLKYNEALKDPKLKESYIPAPKPEKPAKPEKPEKPAKLPKTAKLSKPPFQLTEEDIKKGPLKKQSKMLFNKINKLTNDYNDKNTKIGETLLNSKEISIIANENKNDDAFLKEFKKQYDKFIEIGDSYLTEAEKKEVKKIEMKDMMKTPKTQYDGPLKEWVKEQKPKVSAKKPKPMKTSMETSIKPMLDNAVFQNKDVRNLIFGLKKDILTEEDKLKDPMVKKKELIKQIDNLYKEFNDKYSNFDNKHSRGSLNIEGIAEIANEARDNDDRTEWVKESDDKGDALLKKFKKTYDKLQELKISKGKLKK